MALIDKTYHKLLNTIIDEGFIYEDPNRKGINRIQIPSYKIEHKFKDGFPALTTKKVYFKGAVGELITFLKGYTNITDLWDNEVNFWDKDWDNFRPKGTLTKEQIKTIHKKGGYIYDSTNTLGRIYPHQMRNWEGQFDQIKNLIDTLKTNPMATKKTVTMWNPLDLEHSCLSPCHWAFEILTEPINIKKRNDLFVNIHKCTYDDILITTDNSITSCVEKYLDDMNIPKYEFTLKWHQHSVDTFLGLPINIMYYSLMAQIIGKMTNMIPKGIEGDLSNVHIYEPHLESVKKQLNNDVNKYNSCQLTILDEFHYLTDQKLVGNVPTEKILNELRIDMFKLKNYKSYPTIKAKMLSYIK